MALFYTRKSHSKLYRSWWRSSTAPWLNPCRQCLNHWSGLWKGSLLGHVWTWILVPTFEELPLFPWSSLQRGYIRMPGPEDLKKEKEGPTSYTSHMLIALHRNESLQWLVVDLFPNQWYLCCLSRQDKGSPKVMLLLNRDLIQLSPGHFWPVYPSIFDGSDIVRINESSVISALYSSIFQQIIQILDQAFYCTFCLHITLPLVQYFTCSSGRNQSIPCVLFWRFNSRVSKCGVVFLWNMQHRDSAATLERQQKSHGLSFVMENGIFVVMWSFKRPYQSMWFPFDS